MRICISAESTVDLSKELLLEYNIHTIPFTILLGDKAELDGEITPDKIFSYVEENKVLPRTSAINEYQFNEYFDKLLEEYDVVIHLSLSSDLSCAYRNALNVSNLYKDDKKVYVIDSKSLSTGIGLLAIHASNMVKEGKNPEEIVASIEERIPEVQASFVVNTLYYLYKGGRCSALARLGALIFRLKPQILVANGKMVPGKKFMGKHTSCVKDYCEETLKVFNNPDLEYGFVTHSNASPEAIEIAVNAMKNAGFKKVFVTIANSTISNHCGPKCLGILYFNKSN